MSDVKIRAGAAVGSVAAAYEFEVDTGADTHQKATAAQIKAFALVGTATNDNAVAGSIGEYVVATQSDASPVSLTTSVVANVTSISLTAGDWDVSGMVGFDPGATTNANGLLSAISTSSAAFSDNLNIGAIGYGSSGVVIGGSTNSRIVTPVARLSLSGTTTVYLVARGDFTVSTLGAYGRISARRVR